MLPQILNIWLRNSFALAKPRVSPRFSFYYKNHFFTIYIDWFHETTLKKCIFVVIKENWDIHRISIYDSINFQFLSFLSFLLFYIFHRSRCALFFFIIPIFWFTPLVFAYMAIMGMFGCRGRGPDTFYFTIIYLNLATMGCHKEGWWHRLFTLVPPRASGILQQGRFFVVNYPRTAKKEAITSECSAVTERFTYYINIIIIRLIYFWGERYMFVLGLFVLAKRKIWKMLNKLGLLLVWFLFEFLGWQN